MPKVISKSVVVTDRQNENENEKQVTPYYCLCGQLSLIMGDVMAALPRRQTDSSRVLDTTAILAKLTTKKGDTVFLKRPNGLERQIRENCKKCGLRVCYRSEEGSSTVYLVDGALYNQAGQQRAASQVAANAQSRTFNKFIRGDVQARAAVLGVKASSAEMTFEDEEREAAQQNIDSSYAANARIVAAKTGATKRKEDFESQQSTKRHRGTLLGE
eukprot:Opistho-2@89061